MDEEGAAAEILECLTEADVFMRYKLYDKAQEQVANVLKIEPMNLHGHSILREIFEEKGWVAEAVKECMVLSEIYQDLKDDENARSVLADATRLDPNAPGLLDRMRSLERGQRMPPVTEPAKPAPPAPPQAPPPVEVIEEELEIDLAGLEEPVEEKQPAAEIGKIDLPQVAQPLIAKEGARIEPALPLSDDEEVEMPDIDLDFASFEDVVGIEGGLEEVEGVSVRALFGEIEEKEKKLPIPPPLTPPPAARPSVAKPPEIKQSPPPMTAAKPPEIKQPPPPIAVPKPPKIKHAPPPVAISKPSLVEEEMPELKELREAVASMDIHIESPQQARSAAPATPALPPTAKKPGRPPKASAAGVEPPAITPPPDRPSEPKPLTLDEVLIEDIPELEAIVRTVSKATPKAPPAPSRIPGPPLEDELPGDLISSLDEIEFIDEQRPAGAQLVAPFHPAELLVPGLDETFLQEEAIAPGAEEELTLDLNEKVEITAVSSSPVAAVPDERPAGDKEEFFDLSSELEAELLKAEEIRAASREEEIVTDESQAYQEKSLEELFTEFKKGIEKQLGTEDFDTRYNLGIAYKEMGLIDEAIGEFQIAARDPNKFLECCSLLGLCFMEKGMPKQAVSWLKKGIEMPGHRENEYQGLRYDLGLAYQQIGEYERAMEAFKDVFGYNANYRSVSDRIKETQDLLARSKGQ